MIFLVGYSLAAWKFLTPRLSSEAPRLRVANNEIPAHGALVFSESRIALLRQEGKVHALSLVCTHLGCTVNVTAQAMVCPCHGSVFDRSGKVLQGPADRSLRSLPVVEEGEFVEVLLSEG